MRRREFLLIYGGDVLAGARALFEAPRSQTFGTVATIITAAAGAASLASMGYAAAQGAPKLPNTASASAEVANAQASVLPYQKMLAAIEQEGGVAGKPFYTATSVSAEQRAGIQNQLAQINGQIARLQGASPEVQKTAGLATLQQQSLALQGQLNAIPEGGGTVFLDPKGNMVPESQAMQSFAGFGTADIEGQLAGKMADIQTQLQEQYGPAFAAQALANAEQSDPAGFAARSKELSMIQNQIENPLPINPLSTSLDEQVKARLDAGAGLDPMSQDLLNQAVAQANAARGGGTDAGGIAQEMSTGASGQQRLQAAENAAQQWLSSGATPADVQYKREQQNLANLGAFVGGQTPESQFRNLSGAEQGAAPFYGGQPQPTMPGGAATAAPAYTIAAWQTQLRGQQGQANGWLGGLSGLLSATGGLGQALGPGGTGTP